MDSTSMSPADFSAMMGNQGGGFGGNNGAWWLILLFLFLMGGNGWSNRNSGELNQYATAASQQQILFNQQFDQLGRQINAVGDGISSATYALNNAIATEGRGLVNQGYQNTAAMTAAMNGIQTNLGGSITSESRTTQSQLAECCCSNKLSIANLTAQTDQQTAAITAAIHSEGEQTRALIQTNEIQALRDKVSALEADNRMAGVVRYPTSYAYSAGQSPFCNCGYNNI